jgi:protease I
MGQELEAAGVHYHDREVAVDGNLISSRQPPDIPAFMRPIFKAIGLD